MSRLAIPASVDEAPAASQALLGDVAAKSGRVVTMFRLVEDAGMVRRDIGQTPWGGRPQPR